MKDLVVVSPIELHSGTTVVVEFDAEVATLADAAYVIAVDEVGKAYSPTQLGAKKLIFENLTAQGSITITYQRGVLDIHLGSAQMDYQDGQVIPISQQLHSLLKQVLRVTYLLWDRRG